ncbi:MAG: phosphoribosylglycinamide formyltransferase [Candidatus Nanopelagicales bacterium]|nr:phosphoribosylglycinamide formyltransferase [Candidatus Nanopelagicales bacterium]MCU0296917.1 phosphoribosylglycinamide formyltransferase [Candidatus Nanopelagicales bacterium]
MPARVAVMISGTGTLLQSLIDDPGRVYDIVVVAADRPAAGLQRAVAAGIPTTVVAPADHPDRPAWSAALAHAIQTYTPDWIVSAGFMRIVDSAFLDRFPQRVVNSHPALLPAFPGAHAVADALAYGVRVTGCTVHLVDAGVDTGPIIAQRAVVVEPDDDQESLHERIKAAEWELLPQVINRLVAHGLTVEGRKVRI